MRLKEAQSIAHDKVDEAQEEITKYENMLDEARAYFRDAKAELDRLESLEDTDEDKEWYEW